MIALLAALQAMLKLYLKERYGQNNSMSMLVKPKRAPN
jgi:hypothetical protein